MTELAEEMRLLREEMAQLRAENQRLSSQVANQRPPTVTEQADSQEASHSGNVVPPAGDVIAPPPTTRTDRLPP